MKAKLYNLVQALGKNRTKVNEPMASHTYFKIGGPADVFFEAKSADDLIQAVVSSRKHKIPFFILGSGSNILVGDKGIRGLVIKNRADSIKTKGFHGKISRKKTSLDQAIIEAESGCLVNKLVRYTIEEKLSGLEPFLSLPGTVGGAIYNNSHYRPEKDEFFGNFLTQATVLDKENKVKDVDQKYFRFGYDFSVLQKNQEIVIKASFTLKGGKKDKIWKKATKLLKRRNENQPIGIACSGCMFENISQADAMRLATPNHTRSAGYLIDKAGLKGSSIGKARISSVHANFIENTGGATAKEVLQLVDKIKSTVFKQFGVKLKTEVFLVGEF